MSTNKVIDIFNSLSLISDYNANGLTGTYDRITLDSSGVMTIYNTAVSTSATSGALILNSGGLAINCGQNAFSASQGGALTVGGGAAIAGDLFIGGTVYYSNADTASSQFAYLTLTATDGAVSLTSGALLTFGGIVVQCPINATSSTSGGGLLVEGGASVGQDFYVGGTIFSPRANITSLSVSNVNLTNATVSNYSGTNSTIVNSTISNLFTNKLNVTGGSNTIGSIFTTNGNVGINTTGPSYNLDVNGTFRANGTSGNLHLIATNTTTDVLQLQNTNASGASSFQFLSNTGGVYMYSGLGNANSTAFQNTGYTLTATGVPYQIVAGNKTSTPVIFNAVDNSVSITTTTASNDTSSGSLKVSGGVAIQGNLNVGGQLNINSPFTVNISSTQASLNSTTGAMKLIGGLSINLIDTTNANASSYTAGGSITVSGGIAVAQDTYIGGILDIKSGSNNMNPIKLQSLQISSNYNNGSYTIIQSGNASRSAASFTPIQFTGWNDQSNPKMTINTNSIDTIVGLNATNTSNTLGNIFTTGGNVGIGTSAPSAHLDVINAVTNTLGNISLGTSTQNRKIVMHNTSNNDNQFYGLGINSSTFRYQVDQSGADHVFYAGASSTSSTELLRVKGTGNIIVAGTSNSVAVSSGTLFATNNISTNATANILNVTGLTAGNINFTGSLYQNGALYIASQWSGTTGSTLYYGSSGNVFVGIGTTNPQYTLDVNGTMRIGNTQTSTNSTTGCLVVPGGLSVASTTDASSFTQGGSLTVAGGASIGKTLCVGNYLNMGGASSFFGGSFTAGNNVSAPSNVTGLLFPTATVRSFQTTIAVSVAFSSGTNLYAQYTIDGLQTATGWYIDDSFIGDTTGVTFSIDNTTGQLQYTSTNQINWQSTTLRFWGTLISITGNYLPGVLSSTGNFNVSGILSVFSTTDSTTTSVGALQVTGGAGITKNVSVGGNLILNGASYIFGGTASLNNGTTTNGTVTGLLFPSANYRSFSIVIGVSVTASSSLYSQYTIEGIQRSSGWSIYTTTLGDTIDLTFSINSSGQILYNSTTTYAGWVSTNLIYQATVISVSGSGVPITLPTSGNQTITGALAITSTSNATNTSTGALTVSGGVSCVSDLRVGGNIYGLPQVLIVEEQQTNGTNATTYASGSYVTRILNTTITNTIVGGTLSSNQMTLPAGTYRINGICPVAGTSMLTKSYLYNVTNSTILILGTSASSQLISQTYSFINGIFTLSAISTIAVQQYFSTTGTYMGGVATSSGQLESYTHVEITRLL
jgi:hypothetical protein